MATKGKTPSGKNASKADLDADTLQSAAIAKWAHAVEDAAASRGWSRAQTAAHLNISIGYFNVLLKGGGQNQKNLGRPAIETSAELLNTSVLNVYLQSGMLKLSDLFHMTDHEAFLNTAYKRMMGDADLCSHLPTPEEWSGEQPLSVESKYGIVMLYELASKNAILERTEILAPH